MHYEALFVRALLITVLIECCTAAVLKRTAARRLGAFLNLSRISWTSLLFTVSLASCLTLPYVWFVLPAFLPHGPAYAVGAEIFAFAAEAVFYALTLKIGIKQAALLSFAANAVSVTVGLLI